MQNIYLNDLDNLLNKGAILIDVREYHEYLKKHLDHAINIPLNNILTILDKYKKDSILIFYCKTGTRSKKACEIIFKLGYKNIYNLIINTTLF